MSDLVGYTQDFGAFLASANPNLPKSAVAELVKHHVLTLKDVIDAQATKDPLKAYTALRAAAGHMESARRPEQATSQPARHPGGQHRGGTRDPIQRRGAPGPVSKDERAIDPGQDPVHDDGADQDVVHPTYERHQVGNDVQRAQQVDDRRCNHDLQARRENRVAYETRRGARNRRQRAEKRLHHGWGIRSLPTARPNCRPRAR